MPFHVTSNFVGGSMEVRDASDPADVRLALATDPGAPFQGYYFFRASGGRGRMCRFVIENAAVTLAWRLAGREDYDNKWQNTRAVASYDRVRWFRVPSRYVDGTFEIEHVPERDVVWYAHWAPYSIERHADLMAKIQMSDRVRVETLGESVGGMPIDMLTIGEAGPGKRVCWVIGLQHPSETQTGYFMEGFLPRMIDPHDPVATALLRKAVLHVVPVVNPDGTRRGLTRANAAGANLNREWVSPSMERSPEVFLVRARMEATGVDFCLDCHADGELRCNFLGGPLEIPSRSDRLKGLFNAFEASWASASPDYELGHPYPGGPPETADLTMAWNWIAERFDCLSVLLEQAFKDTSWWQDSEQGWSPERATRFGASFPPALLGVVDRLR